MKSAVSMREIPACAVGEICGAARDLGLVPQGAMWYTEFTKPSEAGRRGAPPRHEKEA